MSEFNDDLTIETDHDSDLVKQLRKQLRDKDRALTEANQKIETFAQQTRSSTLADLLKAHGVNAKVAGLIPSSVEASEDAVKAWLDEYADALNIARTETTESGAGDEGASNDSGEGGSTGLDPAAAAALARVQATQSGGSKDTAVGADRTRNALSDLKGLPLEEAAQKLRELGLVG